MAKILNEVSFNNIALYCVSSAQLNSSHRPTKISNSAFKGYQGETIHSTLACQTYKFKILQNEYATHIIESAIFRLRTEWALELSNQFGDKNHAPYNITFQILEREPANKM